MSTLFVDTINEKTSGNGVDIPGHVLQVKSDTSTTQTNTTSTSFSDTQLSVSITPTSASSKILVMMFCSLRADQVTGAAGHVRVLRDSTDIGGQNYMGWNNASHYGQDTCHVEILDSPATTSAITYKVQVRGQNSSESINFGHDSSLQGITVMEIGA